MVILTTPLISNSPTSIAALNAFLHWEPIFIYILCYWEGSILLRFGSICVFCWRRLMKENPY